MVTGTRVELASPECSSGVLPLDEPVISVQVGRARRKRLTPHLHCNQELLFATSTFSLIGSSGITSLCTPRRRIGSCFSAGGAVQTEYPPLLFTCGWRKRAPRISPNAEFVPNLYIPAFNSRRS